MDHRTPSFVGIDVSKDHLDVAHRPSGRRERVANDGPGVAALAARLAAEPPELVVLEATGGYERAVVAALAAAGLPARVIDPARARAFARSAGRAAKTDAIDAAVLAHFAEAVRPEARRPPEAEAAGLRALVDRRAELVAMRTAEGNRLRRADSDAVRRSLEAHLAYLDERVAELEEEVARRLRAHPDWGPRSDLLRTIPGVGPQTAAALLARLPELGATSGRRAAALAGLAPHARDSGASSGRRHIGGGRRDLRTSLYLAAVSAARHNPPLRAMYRRLRGSGKEAKVALIAVARKLLTIANAVIRDMTPWSPNHAAPGPRPDPIPA